MVKRLLLFISTFGNKRKVAGHWDKPTYDTITTHQSILDVKLNILRPEYLKNYLDTEKKYTGVEFENEGAMHVYVKPLDKVNEIDLKTENSMQHDLKWEEIKVDGRKCIVREYYTDFESPVWSDEKGEELLDEDGELIVELDFTLHCVDTYAFYEDENAVVISSYEEMYYDSNQPEKFPGDGTFMPGLSLGDMKEDVTVIMKNAGIGKSRI